MAMAWRFFRITGETFSENLKKAWQVYKLSKVMKKQIVQFYYQKINGEIRQAFGTLQEDMISDKMKGSDKKANQLLFTYYDTEKECFRSFKKFNLIRIA